MKIIKLIPAFTICFCSAGLLHAQEVKTDIAKPVEVKTLVNNSDKTTSQSTFKPQAQVAATATEAPAASETPSPLTRKEDVQPPVKEKTEVKTVSANDVVIPGGEEGRKIMAGKTTRPKDPIYSPSTADAKPAPPVTKSSARNQQQLQ